MAQQYAQGIVDAKTYLSQRSEQRVRLKWYAGDTSIAEIRTICHNTIDLRLTGPSSDSLRVAACNQIDRDATRL